VQISISDGGPNVAVANVLAVAKVVGVSRGSDTAVLVVLANLITDANFTTIRGREGNAGVMAPGCCNGEGSEGCEDNNDELHFEVCA